MVVKCKKLPTPRKLSSAGISMNPGGKGANQAVAAARLNGIVTFVTKTGNDHFGEQSKLLFEKEGK